MTPVTPATVWRVTPPDEEGPTTLADLPAGWYVFSPGHAVQIVATGPFESDAHLRDYLRTTSLGEADRIVQIAPRPTYAVEAVMVVGNDNRPDWDVMAYAVIDLADTSVEFVSLEAKACHAWVAERGGTAVEQ